MDDALLVRRGQALRDLQRDVERLAHRQGAVGQPLPQRLPLEQLHHCVDDGGFAAEIVDGEDVRMRERRHCLGLSLEAGHRGRIAGERGGQDLDRDIAIKLGVVGAIHLAHAAGAEGRHNLVLDRAGSPQPA